MSEQENNWPACVPPGYRTNAFADIIRGGEKWRNACLAAQADGWRFNLLEGRVAGADGPYQGKGYLNFTGVPRCYEIAHGPVPAGCEVRIGDGVWIVPEGSKAWTPCHRSPKDSQWFSIDPREAGDTSLPCVPYAVPVAKDPAPAPDGCKHEHTVAGKCRECGAYAMLSQPNPAPYPRRHKDMDSLRKSLDVVGMTPPEKMTTTLRDEVVYRTGDEYAENWWHGIQLKRGRQVRLDRQAAVRLWERYGCTVTITRPTP